MSEQLPDGLDLAVEMIATHVEEEVSGCRLAPSALLKKRQGVAAIAAIKSEHAQRVTLQHHAADLAQRVEDLEAERDALRAKHDELLVALHGIGKALGIPEGERSPYSVTCGTLERVNRLAEIEAQEPAIVEAGELRIGSGDTEEAVWLKLSRDIPLGTKLYARPVPAQAAGAAMGAAPEHKA